MCMFCLDLSSELQTHLFNHSLIMTSLTCISNRHLQFNMPLTELLTLPNQGPSLGFPVLVNGTAVDSLMLLRSHHWSLPFSHSLPWAHQQVLPALPSEYILVWLLLITHQHNHPKLHHHCLLTTSTLASTMTSPPHSNQGELLTSIRS